MAVNPVYSFFTLDEFSYLSAGDETTIGVPVKPGEKPAPAEILRRAVMIALGTDDPRRADEFIRQSGIAPRELAPQTRNGATVYEFPVDTDFYASIEQFKETGRALPLGEANTSPVVPDALPNSNPNGTIEKNGLDRAALIRRRLERRQAPQTRPGETPPSIIEGDDRKPKPLTARQQAELEKRNRAIREYTKQGLDGGAMTIPLSLQDLLEIKAASADGDARLEVLTKALEKLGYSKDAIRNVLERRNLASDTGSGTHLLTGGTGDPKADVNNWLTRTIAEWKDRQSINSVNFGRNVRNSGMTVYADLRKQVFLEDLRLREGETGVKLYTQQLELQKKIDEIEAKYKDRIDNSVNLLQKSLLVNARTDEIKQAVDRAYEASEIDFRSTQNASQLGANQTADIFERIVRFGLETNPATRLLPESVKNRIVNTGIGIANGAVYLASAGQGVQDFFTDKAIDALSYGANRIGIDTTAFDKATADARQLRAERWQAYSNLQTANLSRLDAALAKKINLGLPLNAGDIPSFERSVGKMLPQAALQVGLAAATGGSSLPAQIAIIAAVNGGTAFGATYAQTNDTWKATEEAAWNAAQSAVVPITSKIPGLGSEAVDLATGYVVGKLRGANDVEIIDQMLAQGLLGAGFKAGRKYGDLTVAERQTAWQRFRTIAGEVNRAVDRQYRAARTKFDELNGRFNRTLDKTLPDEVAVTPDGSRIPVPRRNLGDLLSDPLFRVKSGEEFRQRYGAELTGSPALRQRLGEVEKIDDRIKQREAMANLEADVLLDRLSPAKLAEITEIARSGRQFVYKTGTIFETLASTPTAAKKEVDGAVGRLARENRSKYGKPDNVQTDAAGRISEVEEIKYFGVDKLEAMATEARANPRGFVESGLGRDGRYIQFNKHLETINAIRKDSGLVKGAAVKGVADEVKYVLTLPKFEANDYLKVNAAVKDLKKAWKDELGIDVEIRYGDFTTSDVNLMTQRLER